MDAEVKKELFGNLELEDIVKLRVLISNLRSDAMARHRDSIIFTRDWSFSKGYIAACSIVLDIIDSTFYVPESSNI